MVAMEMIKSIDAIRNDTARSFFELMEERQRSVRSRLASERRERHAAGSPRSM